VDEYWWAILGVMGKYCEWWDIVGVLGQQELGRTGEVPVGAPGGRCLDGTWCLFSFSCGCILGVPGVYLVFFRFRAI
jgi:hypothetical protein